ncbi:MAG: anhydro-N-acetylmuramic acid kinase [Cyanobacteria bacterium P01_D01_bin.123]
MSRSTANHSATFDRCHPLRVIGLMSGTSMDGIDAALVEVQPTGDCVPPLAINLIASETFEYPVELQQQIVAVAEGHPLSIAELCDLDDAIATEFARAALAICPDRSADCIGSHGQTVFHLPPQSDRPGRSVQLGRGAVIARQTGIPTVSDLRSADMVAGGQGAPLVPRVDELLLRHEKLSYCVQNIGGIGSMTYLPPASSDRVPVGWDTGPGNVLMDGAVRHWTQGEMSCDLDGRWAASGTPHFGLVERWSQEEFFVQPPPKSTGRELFSFDDLHRRLRECEATNLRPADGLATLTEFTAATIADSYRRHLPDLPDRVLLCGGGAKNLYLVERLQAQLDPIPVSTTAERGLCPDAKEAIAFAVLAYLRWFEIPGNLPSVTGAADWCLLGELHHPYER